VSLGIPLTEANWNAVLSAINTANKFVSLNLSACTGSNTTSGGGLYANGTFAPLSSTSTGKEKIAGLTLPALAMGIVEAGYDSYSTVFQYFTALKIVSGAEVTRIGRSAFFALSGSNGPAVLTSASFPAATFIGNGAFTSCTALTSVTFSAAASIEINNFGRCPILRFTLTGTGSLSTLEDGKMLIRNNTELAAYPSANGAIVLPGSITAIGN
jgi:hypothetical protein